MSHSIIIIDEQIDCMKSNFPTLTAPLNGLKTTVDAVNAAITPINSAQNRRRHEYCEDVQTYVTERCANAPEYEGTETVMEAEISALNETGESLL